MHLATNSKDVTLLRICFTLKYLLLRKNKELNRKK